MTSRRFWLIFAGIEFLLIVFCVVELRRAGDGRFHAYVLDVGQGDAILLRSPSGKQIVVDGGPDESLLTRLGEHLPFLDRTIELLVLTHPDLDHIAAFPEVARRYRIGAVLMTGVAKDSSRYNEFLALVKEKKIPVLLADPRKDIDMGDGLLLDIAWPQAGIAGEEIKDTNNTAIVIRAISGENSIMLTGDIEKRAEAAILGSGVDLKADVLKVAHHGSRTSSSTGFLLAVNPQLAVISVAKDSQYGHPHPDVMERYRHFEIPVRTTAWEGTIGVFE